MPLQVNPAANPALSLPSPQATLLASLVGDRKHQPFLYTPTGVGGSVFFEPPVASPPFPFPL